MEHERISIHPDVMAGKPCIRGTRIPVATVLHWLGTGETPEQLLAEFPRLTMADIHAAQAFASDVIAAKYMVGDAAE
jgi:uncharacterized protein (DUF433 family)